MFLCYNIGERCCLSLQVLLILSTNIIRMVKVANSIECNGKHILKANYLITPFWNVPICSCLSFTCPLLWPIFPHFLQTIDFDYLGSLKLFLDSSFLLFLDFFGLPRAILITSGSITSVCKGGHKFGPLHGYTINEYFAKTVDFQSSETIKHIQFKTITIKQQIKR